MLTRCFVHFQSAWPTPRTRAIYQRGSCANTRLSFLQASRFKTESCVLVSAPVAVLYAAVCSLTQSFKQRLRVQPWFSLLFLFFVSFFSFLFFVAFVCPFSPREIAWEKSKVRTGPHLQPVFREKNHAAKNGPTSKQKWGRRERETETETETERELELTHRSTHKRGDTTLTSLTKCR